jgi:two-component system chemotaxis response regulator CheY
VIILKRADYAAPIGVLLESAEVSQMGGLVNIVLIVDDLPMIRTALRNMLNQLHIPCMCSEAGDGLDAMKFLTHERCDLVLLDWNMPFLSGIEFLKKARALGLEIPIIMITGESDTSSVIEATSAGITDYIVKPITVEVLREKLSKLPSFKGFL